MESFYRAIFCFALLANPYAKTRRKMIQYCEIREKMTECTGQGICCALFLLFILRFHCCRYVLLIFFLYFLHIAYHFILEIRKMGKEDRNSEEEAEREEEERCKQEELRRQEECRKQEETKKRKRVRYS